MRILLSNDDGYLAPGLAELAEKLSSIADIVVVAPERDRSGASNSLTLDRPLSLHKSQWFLLCKRHPNRLRAPSSYWHAGYIT